VEDFTPIALMAQVINTLVVHPSLPVTSVKELIAYAKEHPNRLNYASAGSGSTNHLSAVLFERAAGIEMTLVPYKGGAPAVLDTVGNQTQVMFTAATQSLPHVKSGKLRLLGVTEARRSTLLADTPTVGETLPGYELSVWYGLFGPPGLPRIGRTPERRHQPGHVRPGRQSPHGGHGGGCDLDLVDPVRHHPASGCGQVRTPHPRSGDQGGVRGLVGQARAWANSRM
jgi:hypothetical protein